ncbi:insulin-like receptor [Anopheles albimanus]|uniref:insulin-like receptor n=1 Tax=Anopheles albimanus TaxID=7167 RepID=UPI001640DFA9|nr:insulin-like receptor [Anopheles albimanus]XP_035790295.1 insulin-like receptor [Anopheles albimanus]XP_035790296.1 insulin-like receptor [Anopheles albimanus]XP_035790297.1 insulin-like receptor [Anopheles albimanus]XP_035790298.1 insulin-like receptor [Anopheles albimanus]
MESLPHHDYRMHGEKGSAVAFEQQQQQQLNSGMFQNYSSKLPSLPFWENLWNGSIRHSYSVWNAIKKRKIRRHSESVDAGSTSDGSAEECSIHYEQHLGCSINHSEPSERGSCSSSVSSSANGKGSSNQCDSSQRRWRGNQHSIEILYLWIEKKRNRTSLWKRWRWKLLKNTSSARDIYPFLYLLLLAMFCCASANGADVNTTFVSANQGALATTTDDDAAFIVSKGRVCSSVDVRNTPVHLERLKGCRVVEGFVQIMLIDKYTEDSFDNYSFPLLTEITGYLMMFRVNGLQTLAKLFPNLTIIRGNMLANRYALVIYELMHLKELGLTSLVHIANGAVRIERNSVLCHADTIDWNAIAANGTTPNVINSNQNPNECTTCPSNVTTTLPDGSTAVIKCPQQESNLMSRSKPNYLCWSNKHCQKKCPEKCPAKSCTDNGECCSRFCIGGCTGVRGNECTVCANYNYLDDQGRIRCVDKCPPNMFLFSDTRCVTEAECYALFKPLQRMTESEATDLFPYIPHDGVCLLECPKDYMSQYNATTKQKQCVSCGKKCRVECPSMTVESISHLDQLEKCTIIKGSLSIRLRQYGGENVVQRLEETLKNIEEIDGFLSIVRSYSIISLSFFRELKVIHGNVLTGNLSLSVHDNQNLQELWSQNVTIKKGNVLFNGNPMLCVKKITSLKSGFGPSVVIENEDKLGRSNGDRVPCEIVKLATRVTKLSLDTAIITWDRFKDLYDIRQLLGYVVYYIEAPTKNVTIYEGRDACNSVGWRVDDISNWQDAGQNSHLLTRLTPYTQYAYYVTTYTLSSENKGGQSDITYFRTAPGQPRMVRSLTVNVDMDTNRVVIKWEPPIKIFGQLKQYRVSASLNEEKNDMINQRNYCDNEIENTTPKPNITPQTPIGTTPAPIRDNSQGCSIDECAAFCPDSGPPKIDVMEIENAIQFEDWMHNYVYIKNTKSSSRRRRNILNEDELPLKNDTHVLFPNNTDNVSQQTPTVYSNEKVIGEEYYRTLTESVNTTEISFPLSYFKHSALYQFHVVACRENATEIPGTVVVDEPNHICGLAQLISFRTPRRLDADLVPFNSLELTDNSNSTQRVIGVKWVGPSKPNGVVVSYSIKYQRVDLDSVQAITRCITVHGYNKTGMFLLTKLEAGNYSVRVMATTTAGNGPYTAEKYIFLPKHEGDSPWWIWLLIVALVLVLTFIGVVAFYFAKQKYLPMSNMRLFAHVNPDYAGVTYKVDEWEVPREHIIQLEELGQGSFGMVYKGIVTKLGNDANIPCAIKTVNESATERERESFLIEATVMKEFNTHHVVRLLGVVSVGQPTLVIMELMANGDLKSYLRRHRPDYENGEEQSPQPPTLKQIFQMAIEIADGMAYLAAKKFVHRDLAARNCMVADDLTVKIGDFGMTRDIYETDYYRKGTKGFLPVRWMAPESLKDGLFSSSSDVFSYGVVLWEMATLASQPYQGLTNDQVLRYVIDGGVMERPENCPDKLYDLMRSCWHHRPSARPTFVEIITKLLMHANERFEQVSFFHSPDAIDNAAQPGQGLIDDVTVPLRANEEEDLDEEEDEPYSIEMTDSRLMQNNGPKPDIRSTHSPQR